MVYLEKLDLLAEIGGTSADMDYIANPQRTALELDGRDGEVAVIVSHDADTLLRRSRFRGRGGRRPDWSRLDVGRPGFLGDAPRSGAFFLALLLTVLVFLAVVVFLRVDALTAAFLRFVLVFPVAFFRVAITASLSLLLDTRGRIVAQ